MVSPITDRPPFDPPQHFKKYNLWAERKIPAGYSDGDQRHWPGAPLYRPSPEEFYLCTLGQKWAEKDGIAQPGVQYYIDKLPDGYAMFETDQPGGPQTYRRLFGHPKGRFYDSAARFAPHFLWLMSGMDGDCDCVHCANKGAKTVVQRQPRAPREAIDRSILGISRHPRDLTDTDDNRSSRASSTTGGISVKRTQRQARQAGAPHAVDEEGTEDIYKDCVKKLENAKGGTRGVEIDLTEDESIDWKAERSSLPQYLTQIEQQHCFIPRIGELVLWCPNFLDSHYLLQDPQSSEFKFYSFEQKCFHGFPAWRGGVVAAAPSASVKNGPIDFPDILDTPTKKTAFNTAGFRIETMPDPNDDLNKAMSKQYKYVPLRNLRPLAHWQILLKGIPPHKLHPSIEHALTCMTSLSLLEKWRFNGDWPNARIFCKGVYLGPELVTIGDTVRLQRSISDDDLRPEVLVVESIRYNLLNMRSEHARSDFPQLCGNSYVAFVGSAYTNNLDNLVEHRLNNNNIERPPLPLKSLEVKTLFRSVGAEEYGRWYPWHGQQQKYEVSHEQVLGRLFEADAVRLWTGQRHNQSTPKDQSSPKFDFDSDSILAGRRYATAADARLAEPQSTTEINWFFADTRAEGLAVATINGIDVGKYHEVRTPHTLKQWRMQVKVADGQQIAPEIVDEYIKDLSMIQLYSGARRGRPAGSKVVDGKLVLAGQKSKTDGNKDFVKDRLKPSSQMAGAALATDNDDSSEGSYDSEEVEEGYGTDEDRANLQPVGKPDSVTQAKSTLTKAAIMSSIEVPEDQAFDDDLSDEETWWDNSPPPIRGGTEESEGGDYRE